MVAKGERSPQALLMNQMFPSIVAVLFAAFTLSIQPSAQADTFGSETNTFDISFVNIGDAGNAADTTGYGAVDYSYRIATHEVSVDMIAKANAAGSLGVTFDVRTADKPATAISWNEAARFVNWLNLSSGYTAAYNFSLQPGDVGYSANADISLWQTGDVGYSAANPYRNANAHYFIPSENEWYKSAYFIAGALAYFDYPTGSDSAPISVVGGTATGTAVYNQPSGQGPAAVTNAGGLSPYGTMAQGGNASEWMETAFSGTNSDASNARTLRGGAWPNDTTLMASARNSAGPANESDNVGFRVASVPEPSTYALLLMAGAGALWWARRRL